MVRTKTDVADLHYPESATTTTMAMAIPTRRTNRKIIARLSIMRLKRVRASES